MAGSYQGNILNIMFTNADFLTIDLYAGDRDDAGARMEASRIVTTRKPYTCRFGIPHDIPAGTRARHETAIIDNKWGGFYVCCACLTQFLNEVD